jgi:signal transduction histidine kinase
MPTQTKIAPSAHQPTITPETLQRLRSVPILASLDEESIHCFDYAEELHVESGYEVARQGEISNHFWVLLNGRIQVAMEMADGYQQVVHVLEPGVSFGEVTLLANIPTTTTLKTMEPSHLVRLDEDQFWDLMTLCPGVRKAVLANMAQRLAKMQHGNFHQEKMAALGTMAAGLMHELNNPGAAARRASVQLRENLMRMHRLTAKWARTHLTDAQKQCMFDLQEMALGAKPKVTMSSLDQSDAEEALAEWMESAAIEDAWRIAPTLVSIGLTEDSLSCARATFDGPEFSDAINWLEALVSSMQLVGTIEESIGRVTDLVAAVKSYAYEGRGQKQTLDVNRSIYKQLAPDLPLLHSDCQGLNQIWTNLLDNAIDASPQGGRIRLKTWAERDGDREDLFILVSDNGSGIPAECQAKIFDPFYTTKPVGVGTGLGLGIVHRIVEQFGGSIRFSSMPGETEFVVRLPNRPV